MNFSTKSIFIILIFILVSCTDQADRNMIEAISKKWKYKGQVSDICKQDDFIILEISGKYIYDVSQNKCQQDEKNLEGSWTFYNENKILEINYKDFNGNDSTEKYTLELLTNRVLVLKNDTASFEYQRI